MLERKCWERECFDVHTILSGNKKKRNQKKDEIFCVLWETKKKRPDRGSEKRGWGEREPQKKEMSNRTSNVNFWCFVVLLFWRRNNSTDQPLFCFTKTTNKPTKHPHTTNLSLALLFFFFVCLLVVLVVSSLRNVVNLENRINLGEERATHFDSINILFSWDLNRCPNWISVLWWSPQHTNSKQNLFLPKINKTKNKKTKKKEEYCLEKPKDQFCQYCCLIFCHFCLEPQNRQHAKFLQKAKLVANSHLRLWASQHKFETNSTTQIPLQFQQKSSRIVCAYSTWCSAKKCNTKKSVSFFWFLVFWFNKTTTQHFLARDCWDQTNLFGTRESVHVLSRLLQPPQKEDGVQHSNNKQNKALNLWKRFLLSVKQKKKQKQQKKPNKRKEYREVCFSSQS